MTTPAVTTESAVSAAIMTVTIVTVAKDRREHLERQFAGIDAQTRPPDEHVIIDLGGPPIGERPRTTVIGWDVDGRALPVGEARNRGAALADSDVLIFLDVDCVPTPGLVADYVDLVGEHPGIVCGPVGYLPALAPDVFFDGDGRLDTALLRAASSYHPGRPLPNEETRRSGRYELFWSLSFAVHRSTWNDLGGFDNAFDGYGGDDTDLAWTARSGGSSCSSRVGPKRSTNITRSAHRPGPDRLDTDVFTHRITAGIDSVVQMRQRTVITEPPMRS